MSHVYFYPADGKSPIRLDAVGTHTGGSAFCPVEGLFSLRHQNGGPLILDHTAARGWSYFNWSGVRWVAPAAVLNDGTVVVHYGHLKNPTFNPRFRHRPGPDGKVQQNMFSLAEFEGKFELTFEDGVWKGAVIRNPGSEPTKVQIVEKDGYRIRYVYRPGKKPIARLRRIGWSPGEGTSSHARIRTLSCDWPIHDTKAVAPENLALLSHLRDVLGDDFEGLVEIVTVDGETNPETLNSLAERIASSGLREFLPKERQNPQAIVDRLLERARGQKSDVRRQLPSANVQRYQSQS